MTRKLSCDIVILGGGIAGLWLMNRLQQEGFDAVLLEKSTLGGGQTIASQGIVHGGLKYALNGALSPASSAIAEMPDHWRRCLQGEGDVDLRGCKVLAPHYYMWSGGGYRSRLKSFLGSKALRGRIDTLNSSAYPEFFQNQKIAGALYQLTDFVVDTPSLIEHLAAPHRDRIFQVDLAKMSLPTNPEGGLECIQLEYSGGPITLQAQRYLLCAGEGNGELLTRIGVEQPAMQVRPLHMIALHIQYPHPVYLHCIGDSFGMTPKLTITSHPCDEGGWIWYVGGEIAETGIKRDAAEQQAEARQQLAELFPWVDFDSARSGSFFINRAEPKLPNLQRPDTAYLNASNNLIVTWPTKLTLTPNLGDSVSEELQRQQIVPQQVLSSEGTAKAGLAEEFQCPPIAAPRWQEMFS